MLPSPALPLPKCAVQPIEKMEATLAAAFVEMAEAQQIVAACTFASIALVICEYLATFEQEVEYVWRREWNFGKALFVVIRYLTPMYLPLMAYQQLAGNPTKPTCSFAFEFFMAGSCVTYMLADTVFGLRTWAIWDRSRICCAVLVLSWLATLAVAISTLVQETIVNVYVPFPGVSSCIFMNTSADALARTYYIHAVYQAVVFFATLIRGFDHLRYAPAKLLCTLYRDAFLASSLLFVLTIFNIILLQTAAYWAYGLSVLFGAATSVLPARIILNIREVSMSLNSWDVDTEEPPTLRVPSRVTRSGGERA